MQAPLDAPTSIMKPSPLYILLSFTVLSACTGPATRPVEATGKSARRTKAPKVAAIKWVDTYTAAQKLSRTSGRLIMVYFYADWAPPCRQMEENILSDRKVIGLSRYFVPLRANADANPEFHTKHNVTGYPTLVFLDDNGNEAARLQGAPSEPKGLIPLLEQLSAPARSK